MPEVSALLLASASALLLVVIVLCFIARQLTWIQRQLQQWHSSGLPPERPDGAEMSTREPLRAQLVSLRRRIEAVAAAPTDRSPGAGS
jgi:hypothetical protein